LRAVEGGESAVRFRGGGRLAMEPLEKEGEQDR
jgi:hypothetical protein